MEGREEIRFGCFHHSIGHNQALILSIGAMVKDQDQQYDMI